MHEFQKKFNNLRAQFLDRSQERLETLRVLIEHLEKRQDDMNLLREVRQLFHWCAGSGGVYGFEAVTKCGLQGEEICDRLLRETKPISPEDSKTLLALVVRICESIEQDEQSRPAPAAKIAASSADSNKHAKDKEFVLLVESKQDSNYQFSTELQNRGVKIQSADSCAAAKELIMKRLPDTLVINLPLPDGNGYELAALVRSCPGGERPPIIFISQQAGFLDKVAAIRSGADGFYEHPIDENEILAHIEH
ncbi:MAG: response regulator, partial [Candidatus Obscuribacterales bacterium]|nr:response regulator [Candidatus Obscuribacterales bacterium]